MARVKCGRHGRWSSVTTHSVFGSGIVFVCYDLLLRVGTDGKKTGCMLC